MMDDINAAAILEEATHFPEHLWPAEQVAELAKRIIVLETRIASCPTPITAIWRNKEPTR